MRLPATRQQPTFSFFATAFSSDLKINEVSGIPVRRLLILLVPRLSSSLPALRLPLPLLGLYPDGSLSLLGSLNFALLPSLLFQNLAGHTPLHDPGEALGVALHLLHAGHLGYEHRQVESIRHYSTTYF
jgi:hypothetical protein